MDDELSASNDDLTEKSSKVRQSFSFKYYLFNNGFVHLVAHIMIYTTYSR